MCKNVFLPFSKKVFLYPVISLNMIFGLGTEFGGFPVIVNYMVILIKNKTPM